MGGSSNFSVLRSIAAEILINSIETSYVWPPIFREICLDGNNIGTVGLSTEMQNTFAHHRVCFKNFTYRGLVLYGSLIGSFNQSLFMNCVTGIYAYPVPGVSAPNHLAFNGCYFYNNTTMCVDFHGGQLLRFDNCDFELNGTNANAATGCISFTGGGGLVSNSHIGLVLRDSWFERNNGTLISLAEPPTNFKQLSKIDGCHIFYNTSEVAVKVLGASTQNKLKILDSDIMDTAGLIIDGTNASVVNDNSDITGTVTKNNSGTYYTVDKTAA
jgi:hypothetical protein